MSASRVARKPVTIPAGVEVKLDGTELAIKGPKGRMVYAIHPLVQVVIEGNLISVEQNKDTGYVRKGSGSKLRKSITGTARATIANLVHGVTHLFQEKLLLVGVGYKAQVKGKFLGLTLGYSHPIDFPIPEGVTIETPTPTEVIGTSPDTELLGLTMSKIRAFRPPEPYKGKGIRNTKEVVERKETKKK